MEYNADVTGKKYKDIAKAMGVQGVDETSVEEYRTAAVRQLSADVDIPAGLKESAKKEDPEFLAQSA